MVTPTIPRQISNTLNSKRDMALVHLVENLVDQVFEEFNNFG